MTFRLAVAFAAGLTVLSISLYVAWQNAIESPTARFQQYYTQRELKRLGAAISEYQKRFGRSPHSIEELGATNQDSYVLNAGLVSDAWHRPFIFNVSETNAVVISYGRDGRPGGIGLDCDLSSTNWAPAESADAPHNLYEDHRQQAHEPFVFPYVFPDHQPFNFCTTAYKPYDEVVTACLIVARDHFPSSVLEISSDGSWADWTCGAALYSSVFGRPARDPMTRHGLEPSSPKSLRFNLLVSLLLFLAVALGYFFWQKRANSRSKAWRRSFE